MLGLLHSLVIACWPLPGIICEAFDDLVTIIKDVIELITNPVGFVFTKIWSEGCKPKCGPDSLEGFLTGAISNRLAGPYQNAFKALVPTGWIVAAMAGGMRILRGVYDDRTDGVHIITDTLVRFGGVLLVLGPPNGTSVAWDAIQLFVGGGYAGSGIHNTAGTQGLVSQISQQLATTLGSSGVWGGNYNYTNWEANFGILGASGLVTGLGWIPAICMLLILIMLCYIGGLMVLRMCMLTFAVCLAPVCIATLAFDNKNKFFTWWSELFTACLLIPIVTTVAMVVTMGVASRFSPADVNSSGAGNTAIGSIGDLLITTLVIMCGLWFTGKMVHQLTWRHFSHGGVTGAMTAVSTTAMALPSMANDVRAMASAAGFQIKKGGLLDRAASARSNTYGLPPEAYRGGGNNSSRPGGNSNGGGGYAGRDVGGTDMTQGLNSSDMAAVQSAGGAPQFHQFVNETLDSMGTQGQFLKANMAALPPTLVASMAASMVPQFLAGNHPGAAATLTNAFMAPAQQAVQTYYGTGNAAPPAAAAPNPAAPPAPAPAPPAPAPPTIYMGRPTQDEMYSGLPPR